MSFQKLLKGGFALAAPFPMGIKHDIPELAPKPMAPKPKSKKKK